VLKFESADYRPIFKIDPHAACTAPSEDENGRGVPSAIFKIDAYDGRFFRHWSSPAVLKISPKDFVEFFKSVRKCCILYNKNGGINRVAAQCCRMYNNSGDVPGFAADFAQIVAQNATLPFL